MAAATGTNPTAEATAGSNPTAEAAATGPKPMLVPPNPISREVVEIYNQLVESGRWDVGAGLTTTPSEFKNTLLRLHRILTGIVLTIPIPKKNELKITTNSYEPLKKLIESTSTASSRKTLKRSHKSSSRKQTYKHSKKQ